MDLARRFYDPYRLLFVALGKDPIAPSYLVLGKDTALVQFNVRGRMISYRPGVQGTPGLSAAADTLVRGLASEQFCQEMRVLEGELRGRLGLP